jgi:hypothetical protein
VFVGSDLDFKNGGNLYQSRQGGGAVETKRSKRRMGLASSILMAGLGATPAFAGVIYADIAAGDVNGGPEGTSYASSANGAYSFGSVIDPSSTGAVNNAVLMMSNYATASRYGAAPGSSYTVSMKLTLYQVTGPGTGNTPDTIYTGADLTQIDSDTQSFQINYRPEADPGAIPGGCGSGNSNAYLVSAGVYSCGQLAALDFTNLNIVLTTGTSYLWAATILNSSDPAAQSLNWGINNFTSNISAASNPQYDTNYVARLGNPLPGLVGSTGWGEIGQGEIALTSAPEPATLGLIGLGLLGIGVSVRRNSRKN